MSEFFNAKLHAPEDRCPGIGGNLVRFRCSLLATHRGDHFSTGQLASWPPSPEDYDEKPAERKPAP